MSVTQVDLGVGVKPPGFYVQRSCGLFVAPLPQSGAAVVRAESLFRFIGVLFGKCIQDGRLIDMPLSLPFLKLMCNGDAADDVSHRYRELLCRPAGAAAGAGAAAAEVTTGAAGRGRSYAALLTQSDFELVDPHRARFLAQLRQLSSSKQRLLADSSLSEEEQREQLAQLTLADPAVPLRDLG